MSLRYKLLGIPANIDEVIDRAQRTGEMSEAYAKRNMINSLDPHTRPFMYEVGVRIGRTRVPVYRWERSFNHFVKGIDDCRLDFVTADRVAQERVEELAAELSRKGIPVLYNNEIYCSPVNSEPAD